MADGQCVVYTDQSPPTNEVFAAKTCTASMARVVALPSSLEHSGLPLPAPFCLMCETGFGKPALAGVRHLFPHSYVSISTADYRHDLNKCLSRANTEVSMDTASILFLTFIAECALLVSYILGAR